MNGELLRPVIPETVTVHLGRPDAAVRNVTVPFADYIKNVASSEIYPTWPDAAIRANIYAQISFVLNRIYTEYYRSRGYDFDITNSTAIDQSFVYGRDIFGNISEIVDEIFNSYLRRRGSVEPLFAAYCDGVEVQCNGLSQWGTVELAVLFRGRHRHHPRRAGRRDRRKLRGNPSAARLGREFRASAADPAEPDFQKLSGNSEDQPSGRLF